MCGIVDKGVGIQHIFLNVYVYALFLPFLSLSLPLTHPYSVEKIIFVTFSPRPKPVYFLYLLLILTCTHKNMYILKRPFHPSGKVCFDFLSI